MNKSDVCEIIWRSGLALILAMCAVVILHDYGEITQVMTRIVCACVVVGLMLYMMDPVIEKIAKRRKKE